jgi:anti-sigma B factor antagonist
VRLGVGVRVLEHGGIPVACLEGEIDIANAAEVRNKLLASLSDTTRGVILDLSGLSYLDSRGVQLVLELAERMKIRHLGFRIVMPERSVVKRILLLTHVDTVVPIDASVDEAVGRMTANGAESGGSGSPNPATVSSRFQSVPPGSSVDSL